MYYYTAFGLTIESEIELPQVLTAEPDKMADVSIVLRALTEAEVPAEGVCIERNKMWFSVDDLARFRITNGNLVEVCPLTEEHSRLAIFLLGSCMGAILHQRGEMPLHGSCISKGTETILITGDSGAGKSTLAAVFVRHGWKLLTDDVALIRDPEGRALVQPSYPSQKLWEDSPELEEKNGNGIHTLYEREEKKKYGVLVNDVFQHEPRPLTAIVRLVAAELPTQVSEIENFAKVDQIMRNTYREYMILREDLERHFQRCVTLAGKVRMLLAIRNVREESRDALYQLITGENGDMRKKTLKLTGTTKLKRKENLITADMQGSAVTMDIHTGQYYNLGETGGDIWNRLKTEKTYDSLLDEITKEYEISRSECEADVEVFLMKLIKDGLILAE